MRSHQDAFLSRLEEWVRLQRRMLEAAEKTMEELETKGDRLALVIATRAAFQHMMRTLRAFDQWLQDPFIINHMPLEMIQEVWRKTWDLFRSLLELDIKHTSEYMKYLRKLAEEGKLSPLLTPGLGREIRRGEERPTTMTI